MRTFDDLNSCDLFWMDQTKRASDNSHLEESSESVQQSQKGGKEVKMVIRVLENAKDC